MDIQDRVALVTGAGMGTGQAISQRLAERGATVALTDVPECAETLRRIREAGSRAEFVAADLTTPDGVQTAVDFALDSFGSLDILVNNAGGIPYDTPGFPHRDPQDWSMVLDLNLRVPLLAIQLALPSLAARNGTVVNIGSTAGLDDEPCHSPEYSAAKAGLIRPPPVSLDALYDAVVNLIEDEEARGKVVELR